MEQSDTGRRRFLTIATSFVAGAGIVATSIPFLGYWKPSRKAKNAAAPVKIDISKIESGSMITVNWQGKPVWILRRTEESLNELASDIHLKRLRDPDSEVNQQPDYAKNQFRSIRDEIFIAIGICTHLGCVPSYKPDGYNEIKNSLYFCPCHGSKFDLAGRVYKNVPAPSNLIIPPHRYLNDAFVEIGMDKNLISSDLDSLKN